MSDLDHSHSHHGHGHGHGHHSHAPAGGGHDRAFAIGIALNGLTGPVTVNGTTYNSVMPPMSQLNDDEIANILTFALNSWGNNGGVVTAKEVTQVRSTTKRAEGAAH